jgi:ubiquinone biosynthesis protein UbiJ
MPAPRGGEPTSLVFHAIEEIDSLKRAIEALVKRLEALEVRVAAFESPHT